MWIFYGFKFDFVFYNDLLGVDLSMFMSNGEWDLLLVDVIRNEVFYGCCFELYLDLIFEIRIKWCILFYINNLIVFCIVLVFLIVMVFLFLLEIGEWIFFMIIILLGMIVFMIVVIEVILLIFEVIFFISIYFFVVMIEVFLGFFCICISFNIEYYYFKM